jgi:hypothetical protein
MIEVFGIAFSIMGLLPSIASTLAYSIPAGPGNQMKRRKVIEEISTNSWPSRHGMGLVPRQHVHLLRWTGYGRSWFCDAHLRRIVLVRKAPLTCPSTYSNSSGGHTTSPRQQRVTPSPSLSDIVTPLGWLADFAPSIMASHSCY